LGLVGVGGMGTSHLKMEHGVVEEIRFTALCDVNRPLLEQKSRELDLPGFADYHALIDSGRCEAVLIATPHPFHAPVAIDAARRGTWKSEGGGVLMNQAPHSLDLFIWLAGRPRSVTAQAFTRGHDIEVEDTAGALLDYGDGYTGYLYTTTAQWPGRMRLEISGE